MARSFLVLEELMKSSGLNYFNVAPLLGIKPASSYFWRDTQNIRLSHIYELAQKLGYDFEISIADKKLEVPSKFLVKTGSGIQVKKLAFLYLGLSEKGINMKQLAEDLGIHYQTVRNMFRQDDIDTDRLDEICNFYGMDVRFHFKLCTPAPSKNSFDVHCIIEKSIVF